MIIIGSDHTGIKLKKRIIEYLYKNHIEYADVTNYESQEGDDYPDIASTVCSKVLENKINIGIAICGTGIGISIACNKVRGIRAANCINTYMAEMSRKHNNSNVLCLGARLEYAEKPEYVEEIVNSYINSFFEGGRHERRLNKIKEIENMNIGDGE